MTNKYKNSIPWEVFLIRELQDEQFAKEFLNDSFMEYINGGNFNMFFRSLERVIKARMTVTQFAKEAEIDRTNLYALFKGKKKPQLKTVIKILTKLGYTLKIA
ncbi:MAG: helix-turn-helix domain-containing protein [Candidatus Gastranaerophilales bacterium]|nr:helix-turn-helix domain-containing protein [Candidatus Gastranaerophilales bacterium]